ncbi:quinone oxidoreductase-like protein 2 [Zootoca vivipara]|uniref:quinone oxidoreductase-like protein 2 n=1 Tax=Zootoca vivipara TaxID=8524 RepID=UPI00293C12EA|nr:quinone oxidoreductase-like protein 2 [Zootoca vivipara]
MDRRASRPGSPPERNAFGRELLDPVSLSSLAPPPPQPQRTYQAALCTELKKPLVVRGIPSSSLQPHEMRVLMAFSGDVMETGETVNSLKEGDHVIGVANTKALAEEYIADQKRMTAAPGATGLPTVDVTTNVLKAKVGPLIAAAGSDSKYDLALQKGALQSVNYSSGSLREEVKKLTENIGADVLIDTVGGDIFKKALHRLRSLRRLRGLLVSCCRLPKIHPLVGEEEVDEWKEEVKVMKDGKEEVLKIREIFVRPFDQGMESTDTNVEGSGSSETSS